MAVTVGIIGAVVAVLSASLSAYAAYEQAQAQSKVLKYNAREAEIQADAERQKNQFAAQQQAEADRRTRAAARAIQGTSGVVVGQGSSLLVDLDSAKQAELNFQAIRFAGDQRVRALTAQATLDRAGASNVSRQGSIGAGATLLGGIASGYSQYSQAQPKSIQVPASGQGTSFSSFSSEGM